ncbi:hypothetical protein [Entomobacter blattae]|uniref:hypothetical protein n=1 Tax=Entomobacter blattae TaxID=2762277 RepID=UPI00193C5CBB|nr:hypothetical protein [Entomobacter blattae]
MGSNPTLSASDPVRMMEDYVFAVGWRLCADVLTDMERGETLWRVIIADKGRVFLMGYF